MLCKLNFHTHTYKVCNVRATKNLFFLIIKHYLWALLRSSAVCEINSGTKGLVKKLMVPVSRKTTESETQMISIVDQILSVSLRNDY
jgi:hypothetical protein